LFPPGTSFIHREPVPSGNIIIVSTSFDSYFSNYYRFALAFIHSHQRCPKEEDLNVAAAVAVVAHLADVATSEVAAVAGEVVPLEGVLEVGLEEVLGVPPLEGRLEADAEAEGEKLSSQHVMID
jgi:hypothetical protein